MGPEFRFGAYIRATLVTRDFGHSKNCAVTNQVPLGRYFLFVGSLLLGMLFISDWYFPKASSPSFFREARVDKSIIRIKSAHKWPEPIVSTPASRRLYCRCCRSWQKPKSSTNRSVFPVEFAIAGSLERLPNDCRHDAIGREDERRHPVGHSRQNGERHDNLDA
jgi:hypothetical protein